MWRAAPSAAARRCSSLERMGFPVWSVPTVTLPWHLGHGRATRIAAEPADFAALAADLAGSPWLGEVGAVLSGYLGGAAQAEPVADLVAALKARNPAALYLCDPIVGDSDGLFVPEAVAGAIRDRLVPLADILTPNRYRTGLARRRRRSTTTTRLSRRRDASARGRSWSPPPSPSGRGRRAGRSRRTGFTLVTHRRLPEVPHGTGDLFAALYLAHRLDGRPPPEALSRATSSVFALIERAVATGADEMPLAAGQDAFAAEPSGVTLTRLA